MSKTSAQGAAADTPSVDLSRLGVCIVHDSLNQRGGAERTVLEMARMWPDSAIYTPLYRPDSTFAEFRSHTVRTSVIDRLPVDQHFRALLPLYPAALRSLGVLDHDLVLSSSAGWAHAVRTAPACAHVVYCHAPARWLYETDHYVNSGLTRNVLRPVLSGLRIWDQRAAHRADAYIANAANVRERIRDAYGIGSRVVHPPVDTHRFEPTPRGERLLVVSRLLSYKRVDLAIEAAALAGIGLDVVGTGPERERLSRLAGSGVRFHGSLDDDALRDLIQSCWALCVPGAEDFGIAALEANAAGKPVIAYGVRGARETVVDGITGVLFAEQSARDVAAAIRRAREVTTGPEVLADHASRFSPEAFRRNLTRELVSILDRGVEGR